MQKVLEVILYQFARLTLEKYQPICVGVTGSVGKSSTKAAIALVLARKYRVGASAKNYNNELGLPLAILGEDAHGKNILAWCGVFLRAVWRLLVTDQAYPQLLVLEMGVDKPGDMDYLTRLAPCETSVLTAIGASHLEQLGSVEGVLREKIKLVKNLEGNNAIAVLNADDPLQMGERKTLGVPVITYGMSSEADVRVMDVRTAMYFDPEVNSPLGIACTLKYGSVVVPFSLSGIVGVHQLSPVLAACAVGVHYGVDLSDCEIALAGYMVPKGRMRLLPGIKGTLIIDDSYNSSPLAAHAALDTLASIGVGESARRVAILGDMRELGEASEEAHRELGAYVAGKSVDVMIMVGKWGQVVADAAIAGGMDKSMIWCFNDAHTAGLKAQEVMKRGDVVLVKGSQNTIRLERAVKEIMAEPERAAELLVRQGKEWSER